MADRFGSDQDPSQDSLGLSDQEIILAQSFGLNPTVAVSEYQDEHATASSSTAGSYARGWGRASYAGSRLPSTTAGKRRVIDAYKELSEMGPDELSSLQHRLYDAGFYDDAYYKKGGKDVEWGALDDGTVSAFGDTLTRSIRSGGRLTPDDVLNDAIGKGGAKSKEATTRKKPPPLTIELTPADDLLPVADATARKILGRKLTDPELRHFIDSFHSMEANAQQSKYTAEAGYGYDEETGQLLGPGGTITASPNAGAFAMSQLRAEHPEDVRNTEMAQGFEIFHDLLRGNA